MGGVGFQEDVCQDILVQIPMLTEINSSQLKNFTGGMDLIVLEDTGFDNFVSWCWWWRSILQLLRSSGLRSGDHEGYNNMILIIFNVLKPFWDL